MEKILLDAVLRRMDETEVIRENQAGFTKGNSCPTSLVGFYGDVAVSLNRGIDADVIYLDFSKALDMVPQTFFSPNCKDMVLTHGLFNG